MERLALVLIAMLVLSTPTTWAGEPAQGALIPHLALHAHKVMIDQLYSRSCVAQVSGGVADAS